MTGTQTLDRRAVVKTLMADCPDVLAIAGLGSSAYDLFAAGCIGLGLALAQPKKSVLVLTGDGEQLMGLGALATIGAQRPPNLTIVVLDNGHYGETGMQKSHTALGTNLTAVAAACGLEWTIQIEQMSTLRELAQRVNARKACGLASVQVAADALPRALPARDGVYLKNRFRAALGFGTV